MRRHLWLWSGAAALGLFAASHERSPPTAQPPATPELDQRIERTPQAPPRAPGAAPAADSGASASEGGAAVELGELIHRLSRDEAEIQALYALDDDERQRLVEQIWAPVFQEARSNREAIELEFSVILDGRLGGELTHEQREAMLEAHRALLDEKEAHLAAQGDLGLAPDAEEMMGSWGRFETTARGVLRDEELWEVLVE